MASRPSRDQPITGGFLPLAVLPSGGDTAGHHIAKYRTHVRQVGSRVNTQYTPLFP